MPATELTPTVKRDLTLLQMRDVLDPKRHYRSSAKNLPKYFQVFCRYKEVLMNIEDGHDS